jgi:hypothetical protein
MPDGRVRVIAGNKNETDDESIDIGAHLDVGDAFIFREVGIEAFADLMRQRHLLDH